MSEIVLLDGHHRYFRAAVLKSRGYTVFTTEHVVEVCLRWARGGCAALIIGPHVQWKDVATLCDWIKINSPGKPVMLLSDHRNGCLDKKRQPGAHNYLSRGITRREDERRERRLIR